nr:MAG TPA: hypothetical protein [Caudoviricetes sp.]
MGGYDLNKRLVFILFWTLGIYCLYLQRKLINKKLL